MKKWASTFSTTQKQEVVESEFGEYLSKISVISPTPTLSHRPILSDFFHIKRGIATGANNFFILSQEEVMKYQLPKDVLTPILPNPRFLTSDEVLADLHGYPVLEEHFFLLTCDLAEEDIKIKHPSPMELFTNW